MTKWENDYFDAAGYSQDSILGMTATIACYTKGDKWFDELKEYNLKR